MDEAGAPDQRLERRIFRDDGRGERVEASLPGALFGADEQGVADLSALGGVFELLRGVDRRVADDPAVFTGDSVVPSDGERGQRPPVAEMLELQLRDA